MAAVQHGTVLSNRWLALISGLAALACAVTIVYLALQIDQTKRQLQDDGVLQFRFVQQVDHNFDNLAQALMRYMVADETDRTPLKNFYIQKFDIVYSSLRYVKNDWLENLVDPQTTDNFFDATNNFLDEYEPMMSSDIDLENTQAYLMHEDALKLSERTYDMGLAMFEYKFVVRDNNLRKMDELYNALWIFGLVFFLTVLMTIALLLAMYRRAAGLQLAADTARVKLRTALDELTTGDIERLAQNRFMAAASHDLRQPLHALGLYLSSLKRFIPSEEGQQILANTHRSTEALKQLLNSMLDLSKLDAGVVDVNRENLNLDVIFDHLLRSFLPLARQRELAFDVQSNALVVNSDRLLLERILSNLVDNALKYTHSGHVTVRAQAHDAQVCISISDTGQGIPLSEQEAVFDEFYQLQNPERDRHKGLGLGLSIVKRLTRLLGIELKINSSKERGTTLQILLPKANTIDRAHQGSKLDKSVSGIPDELDGLSVLIIDDELDVLNGMRTLLTQYGCDVALADSGEQALKLVIANSCIPDLIIADYRLRNDQTGDTAIAQVREEVNTDVPAIIITGDTSPERLREALASGFLLLHKPVVIEDLLAVINTLAGDRKTIA